MTLKTISSLAISAALLASCTSTFTITDPAHTASTPVSDSPSDPQQQSTDAHSTTDYEATVDDIERIFRAKFYDGAALETAKYKATRARIRDLAKTAADDREFRKGFEAIWDEGPVSHVDLRKARRPAAELGPRFDAMQLGEGVVTLTWRDQTAIMTINSFMGADTVTALEAAYDEIAAHGAERLIVDLRENVGGSYPMFIFVGHLIDKPLDAGVFMTRLWTEDHQGPPTREQVENIQPFQDPSVTALWAATDSNALIRMQFVPMEPYFDGPVVILTSPKTASASEATSDALRAAGRAILVGESTDGAMLMQQPFDVEGGFHLYLPVADYYSFASGRIEGVGLTPDLQISEGEDAMNVALQYLEQSAE